MERNLVAFHLKQEMAEESLALANYDTKLLAQQYLTLLEF